MMNHILDEIAKEYVSLMVSKIPHDPWDIYGYLDAPTGKRKTPIDRNTTIYLYTPMPEITPRSVADIHNAALLLEEKLQQIKETKQMDRLDFLRTHVHSLQVRTAMLLGQHFSYDEMTKGLYDLEAPHYQEELFDDALKELKDVLPGNGDIAQQMENLKKKISIPSNKLAATMTAAVEAFHDMAVENMKICKDSAPSLSFYGFGPHRKGVELDGYVYDWDLDRINWELDFSTEHTFLIDDIISFACHEVEPGHLTFIGLRTKAAYENGCPELAIVPQFAPSSAFIEGAARMSIDLCLPGEKLYEFEKDLLFPLAGIDPGLAEILPVWHKYREAANFAKLELERNRWNGTWSKAEGIEWMKKYLLASPEKCSELVDHLAADPGHFVAHDYSRDVITDYIYGRASKSQDRWTLYKKLSMAHISMSGIENGKYEL